MTPHENFSTFRRIAVPSSSGPRGVILLGLLGPKDEVSAIHRNVGTNSATPPPLPKPHNLHCISYDLVVEITVY